MLILKKIQSNIEIKKMEKGEIEEYCEEKGNSTEGEEQQSWKLINSMVCGEKDVINKIVEFDKENVDKELNEYYEKNNLNEKKEVKEIEEEDDDDVFDKIGEENEKKEKEEKKEYEEENEEDKLFAELISNDDKEKVVDFCLKVGRFSDALIISEFNPELHKKVIEAYKEKNWNNKKSLVSAQHLLNNDFVNYVKLVDLEDWKHALYVINVKAQVGVKQALIVQLGDRLLKTNKYAALMCYISCGDINKVVELWIDKTLPIKEVVERIKY